MTGAEYMAAQAVGTDERVGCEGGEVGEVDC